VKNWDLLYEKQMPPLADDRYVVMEVSEICYLQKFLSLDMVVEIYDHHFGSETYWTDRLGIHAHIERVGSCATLVIEEFQQRTPQYVMSASSANLLAWALISNTLNFKASVTHDRDVAAFQYIKPFIDLDDNWVERYFIEHDQFVYTNPIQAMRDDTKNITSPLVSGEIAISQLELWNGQAFMNLRRTEINDFASNSKTAHWLLTIPSIKYGYNYLFTVSDQIKDVLEEKMGASFDGNVGTTKQLYLRKEILRELQS
jgi:hypothetical protein